MPLAIAFGIASGVTPQAGLVTAVVAGFIISAFGGSRVQIGGPTGAFVVIVYGIVTRYGVDGLILATIMAGFILIFMGIARLGRVIEFIPYPVVVGFTSGIAVIILSSQIKDFLGLPVESVPAEFFGKWKVLLGHLAQTNGYAVGLTLFTILVVSVWSRFSRRIPGSIIAILVASAAASYFQWPIETIGSKFGELPHGLPQMHVPVLRWELIQTLIQPATAIALLGAIESLLSAVVADGMIGGRHRSNMELVAQGFANIASGLFGGMPATGAIARTATNVRNGGRTPVAGLVHAVTLFLILIFLGKWAKLIPMACLAGILIVVAYHMSEWRSFLSVLKGPRHDALVILTTFFLTVLVDLTVAIEIGMVLAAFLFMARMAETTNVRLMVQGTEEEESSASGVRPPRKKRDIEIYEVNGPLFFGASRKFEEAMRFVEQKPKVRILRVANVLTIDASGLNALKGIFVDCQKQNIKLLIQGIHSQPLDAMVKSGLYDTIGEENFFSGLDDAMNAARQATD